MSGAPYQKLLAVVGLATFWLCFSSLWGERASQRLKLPLDLFEDWDVAPSGRKEGLTMIAIYVCWPFAIATLYLLARLAEVEAAAASRWERLPAPFGFQRDLQPREKTVYRLFFLLLFWGIPMIHVAHFCERFLLGNPPRPLFHCHPGAWFRGEDANGNDMLYGGLTYFGWTPFLVLAGVVVITALNIRWLRALFRRAPSLQR